MKTYRCKDVLASFGSHSLTGYGEDDFISIEPNGEGTQKKVGCDGEVARSMDPDTTYKGKISLLQTSPSNKELERLYTLDQTTGDGHFPMLITNRRGGTQFKTSDAWIKNRAPRTYGKGIKMIDWEFETGDGKLAEEAYK